MSRFQELKDKFKRRLINEARGDLFGHFERSISGVEKEIEDKRKLLDLVLNPDIKLQRTDVQQLVESKEEFPPEQQERSSSLDQEDPEPPHIKEEQEELWTSQEGEQLQGLEEADITKFTFTPVPVKTEDDEEKPQSSQLHPTLTEHMETEADGGSEPDRNSHPDRLLHPDTDEKASDSSETEKESNSESFSCSECGKTFRRKVYLKVHMQRHTDEKPFSCSVCSKRFIRKAKLLYHMKTHTGEKPFSCSVCGKRFIHRASVKYHMTTHRRDKQFSCSVCGKRFKHGGYLKYHLAIHTGERPFSCSICNKRFICSSKLKTHKCVSESSQLRQRDTCKKPLRCSKCQEMFSNNYSLMTHMRMHEGKKLFPCSVCGQKWQFRSHLQIHMRTHTGEKPYSCSICGKKFTQRGIMQHMVVHSGTKPFSCSDCDETFFWHFQIKTHKCGGGSLQENKTGFDGEDCGGSKQAKKLNPDSHLKPDADKKTLVSFETNGSADIAFWNETRQHQSGVTYERNKDISVSDEGCKADKKPFSCSDDEHKVQPDTDDSEFCKQTRHWQTRFNHPKSGEISVSHEEFNTDKKPSRSECHTKFDDSETLQTHTTCPTGEKLLSCVVCEKRFTLESELKSHTCDGESSQLHPSHTEDQITARGQRFTGEKTFCCSVCNKGFGGSKSLVKHMRVHTEQTPLSCSICGKGFTWRRYLTKHMEVHKNRCFRLLQADTDAETSDSSEPDTDDSDDWTQTRQSQSDLNSMKDKVSESDIKCDADKTSESFNPQSDDSVDSDFWKDTRESLSGLN